MLLLSFWYPFQTLRHSLLGYQLMQTHQHKTVPLEIQTQFLQIVPPALLWITKYLTLFPGVILGWIWKTSLKVPLTLKQIWAFLYIECIILTNQTSVSGFFKAHHTTSPDTQDKAFSISTNAKYIFFFFANYLPATAPK